MRLGVVVPTLNEAAELPKLLERLTTGAPDEDPEDRPDRIVVVDGGSTDGTEEIATRAAGVEVVHSERGRGVQLAAGAARLETDLVLFLHADTCPGHGALRAVRRAFEDPSVGATAMLQRIARGGLFYRCVERVANARSRRGLVYGDSGLCVRRDLYEAVGGFRPLPLFEDVDLSLRLRARTTVTVVSEARLAISARRWVSEGPLRCTLRNWWLSVGFLSGRDPEALARRYGSHAGSVSE